MYPRNAFYPQISNAIEALRSLDIPVSKFDPLLRSSKAAHLELSSLQEQFSSPATFSRFVDVHNPEGMYLFGSKIRSKNYKQLQIIGAKENEEGELVPDEAKVLIYMNISEESLSRAIMDLTGSNAGYPATIEVAYGSHLSSPTAQSYTSQREYFASVNEKRLNAEASIDSLLKIVERIQDSEVRITADIRKELKRHSDNLERVAGDSNNYDLELLVEKLEKDQTSIFFDVVSNIRAILINNHHPHKKQIETKIVQESAMEKIVNYFTSKEVCDLAFELISEVKEHIDNPYKLWKSFEDFEHFFKKSSYYSTRVKDRPMNAGIFNVVKTHGTSKSFGDLRTDGEVIGFEIGLGNLEVDTYSVRYHKHRSILKINFTNNQYLQLLMSSLAGTWTKSTLTRNICTSTDLDELEVYSHETLKRVSVCDVRSKADVIDLTKELNHLLASKGQSKALRLRLLELTLELSSKLRVMHQEREIQFIEAGGEIQKQAISNQTQLINSTLRNVVELRPELKDKIEGMLGSSMIELKED